jgi:hypothetical protein
VPLCRLRVRGSGLGGRAVASFAFMRAESRAPKWAARSSRSIGWAERATNRTIGVLLTLLGMRRLYFNRPGGML